LTTGGKPDTISCRAFQAGDRNPAPAD